MDSVITPSSTEIDFSGLEQLIAERNAAKAQNKNSSPILIGDIFRPEDMPVTPSSSEIDFSGLEQLITESNAAKAPKANKNSSPILIGDVLTPDEGLSSLLKNIQHKPLSLNELLTYYAKPHAAKTRENGLLHSKPLDAKTYPIHIAARDGDVEKIKTLLEQGNDLNKKDLRSITPLHVSVLFGQKEVVSFLIKNGAHVDSKGYENHTALHFALMKGYYEIAKILIVEGKADPTQITFDGQNAFNYILDDLGNSFLLLEDPENEIILSKIDDILDMLSILVSVTDVCHYLDIIEHEATFLLIPMPISMILTILSCYAPTQELQNKFLQLAEFIREKDPSEEMYVLAKNILHMFPTGEIYTINIGEEEVWIQSEGYFGIYTTALASSSLDAYVSSVNPLKVSETKLTVLNSLQSIYQSANYLTSHVGQAEAAWLAFELYERGETVLLPSGWEGHFVDIIISKSQTLYVVANSGARYSGESPDYEGDPAGLIFYNILAPDLIDVEFFYNILNNQNQIDLELENAYQYSVFEKVDEIVRDSQEYGNCGWESHRDAVEGILYVELLNQGINEVEAKGLAHEYYEEWDHFHGIYVADQYIANNPGLPLEALLDMFKGIHKKDHFTQKNHDHAQKIADMMMSPYYIDAFKNWLSDPEMDLVDKLTKNILQEQHGIDVDALFQDNVHSEITSQPEVLDTLEAIHIEYHSPHIDNMLALEQPQIFI